MASCRRSSEIEGAKNRLSPLGQKSKIPVRRGTRLNNNSGKRSLAKDEVNMKQRILRNRVEKSQNKPPSRIPIAIRRMSCKDVDRSVITTTGKRPLGTESGILNIFIAFEAFSFKLQKVMHYLNSGTKFFIDLLDISSCNVFIQSLIICLVVFHITLLIMDGTKHFNKTRK